MDTLIILKNRDSILNKTYKIVNLSVIHIVVHDINNKKHLEYVYGKIFRFKVVSILKYFEDFS